MSFILIIVLTIIILGLLIAKKYGGLVGIVYWICLVSSIAYVNKWNYFYTKNILFSIAFFILWLAYDIFQKKDNLEWKKIILSNIGKITIIIGFFGVYYFASTLENIELFGDNKECNLSIQDFQGNCVTDLISSIADHGLAYDISSGKIDEQNYKKLSSNVHNFLKIYPRCANTWKEEDDINGAFYSNAVYFYSEEESKIVNEYVQKNYTDKPKKKIVGMSYIQSYTSCGKRLFGTADDIVDGDNMDIKYNPYKKK